MRDIIRSEVNPRYRALKVAESVGGYPTTAGLAVPRKESIPDYISRTLDESMGRAALPSRALANLSQAPTEVAAQGAPDEASVAVPAEQSILGMVGRGAAGAGGALAGALEFPFTGTAAAVSAGAKNIAGKSAQGGEQASQLTQGALDPIKATTDILMDPSKFWEDLRRDPGGQAAKVGMTVLGALGAKAGVERLSLRMSPNSEPAAPSSPAPVVEPGRSQMAPEDVAVRAADAIDPAWRNDKGGAGDILYRKLAGKTITRPKLDAYEMRAYMDALEQTVPATEQAVKFDLPNMDAPDPAVIPRYAEPGPISSLLGAVGPAQEIAQLDAWIPEIKAKIGEALQSVPASWRPAMTEIVDRFPDVYSAAVKYLARNQKVDAFRKYDLEPIINRIPRWLRDDFVRWAYSEQARAIAADPARAEGVKIRVQTPQERADFMNSPGAAELIAAYRTRILPQIEEMAPDAGVREFRDVAPDAVYLPMRHLVEGDRAPAIFDPETGSIGRGPTGKQPVSTGGRWVKYGSKRTRSAMRATAGGDAYDGDLQSIIESAYRERIEKARHNQLREIVKRYENVEATDSKGRAYPMQTIVIRDQAGIDVGPNKTMVDPQTGKRIVMERGKGEWASRSIRVPKPIADAWRHVEHGELPDPRAVRWLNMSNRALVALPLFSEAEAIGHMLQVLGAVSRVASDAATNPAVKVLNGTPVLKYAGILGQATSLKGPRAVALYNMLAEYGGTRTTHWFDSRVGKYARPGKLAVFGAPGEGAGVVGLETRARAVGLEMLLQTGMDPAKAVGVITGTGGAYIKSLAPPLVNLMRMVPLIGDPFAATGIPSIVSSTGRLLGRTTTRRWSPGLFAQTWGTITAVPILMNKAITGKYPWELPGLKPGDIQYYPNQWSTEDEWKTANQKSIPMRIWAAETARGWKTLGRDTLGDWFDGKANSPEQLGMSFMRAQTNNALARLGPAGRAALALSLGKTGYVTSGGDLMGVADESMQHPVARRFEAAARELLPYAGENRPGLEPIGRAERSFTRLGVGPSIRPPQPQMVKTPESLQRARAIRTADDISMKANGISDPQQRAEYIERRMQADVDPSMEGFVRRRVQSSMQHRIRSIIRSNVGR